MSRLEAARRAISQGWTEPPVAFSVSASMHYSMLKNYTQELRGYGLKLLAEDICAGREDELPAALKALGQQTQAKMSVSTAAQESANKKLLANGLQELLEEAFQSSWQAKTLVVSLGDKTVELVEQALNSYCLIVEMVTKIGDGFLLQFADRKIFGGWALESPNYDDVQLPEGASFNREEQDATVFAMGAPDLKLFLKAAELTFAADLIAGAVDTLLGKKGSAYEVTYTHVLFCFNAHTSYSFHQDAPDLKQKVDYTVMLMLSPGDSTMRVAGADEDFKYEFPGAACMFDACALFHRSGTALLRTVKLCFFVTLTDAVDVDKEPAPKEGKTEVKPEPEVKQEPEEKMSELEKVPDPVPDPDPDAQVPVPAPADQEQEPGVAQGQERGAADSEDEHPAKKLKAEVEPEPEVKTPEPEAKSKPDPDPAPAQESVPAPAEEDQDQEQDAAGPSYSSTPLQAAPSPAATKKHKQSRKGHAH